MEQRAISKRLMIAFPLFLCVFGMVFVDFNVVWRYFAWTNQTLAVFTLWAATTYLYKQEHRNIQPTPYRAGYLISLIPAMFMTVVSVSYIMIAPEGLHLPQHLWWVGYTIALCVALACLGCFAYTMRKCTPNS
jgi:carbon starvation protein CstA